MKSKKAVVSAAAVMSLLSFSCNDTGTSPSVTPFLSVPLQYATIQQAINTANPYDSILVLPGRYLENIDFLGKPVVVRSTHGLASTTIDGDARGSTVTFSTGETAAATLDGFTIVNGSNGGIRCDSNSSPTLKNLRITTNLGSGGGGIVCETRSSPIIQNVTLIGNTATSGGGIYCWNNSHPQLRNVRIVGNTASSGGGLLCGESSSPVLENVLIAQNSAPYGGGVAVMFTANPTFRNVTIAHNSSLLSLGGIYCNSSLSVRLTNSIVWANAGAEVYFEPINSPSSISFDYCDVDGAGSEVVVNNNGTVNWLSGNISADPAFRAWDTGDFHLLSGSPGVNAGDPSSDHNDPDGSRNDLGAYGGPFGNWN